MRSDHPQTPAPSLTTPLRKQVNLVELAVATDRGLHRTEDVNLGDHAGTWGPSLG